MWRTVIVNRGERITTKDNWLVIATDSEEQRVPIDDIYSVVLDNRDAFVSICALTALTNAGVNILLCDEKHVPVSVTIPLNTHYKPLSVIKKQLSLTQEFKDFLWERIIKAKIENQITCLKLVGVKKEKIDVLKGYVQEIIPGDKKNREGAAARKYFTSLFGCNFTRSDEDVTNAALNYGYAIIRSCVCKTLTAYGYNCVLGIHHINESNAFNLADDIMEPLRPVVDLWTDNNCDCLFSELSKTNRRDLVNLINVPIRIDGKKTKVRYAIDRYVSSLTSAIENKDPTLIKLPELVRIDGYFEDDEDDE